MGDPLAPPATCDRGFAQVCNAQCWCWESPAIVGNDLGTAFALRDEVWALVPRPLHWTVPGKAQVVRLSPSPGEAHLPPGMIALWIGGPAEVWGAWDSYTREMPAVLRWDGSSLVRYPLEPGATSPRAFGPVEIYGSGPDDVWAVVKTVSGLLVHHPIHWDGATWELPGVDLPSLTFGIWTRAPDDVWMRSLRAFDMLVQFDGTDWWAHYFDFIGTQVYGVAKNDTWFLGWYKAAHWNGSTWTTFDIPAAGLNAAWGAAPDDIWSVGDAGGIIHWDGSSWQRVESGTSFHLKGIAGLAADDIWVTGDAGTVLHWDGSTWTSLSGGVGDLNDVWGTSDDDVWAVGRDLLHRSSTGWRVVLRPAAPLRGVWGTGPDDVWAVGDGGQALHYDGAAWSAATIPPSGGGFTIDLKSVWGASPDAVWAVGTAAVAPNVWSGVVLHWDGGAWTLVHEVAGGLDVVRGSGANDVWATTLRYFSLPQHWDGTTWREVRNFPWANGLWARGRDDIWAFSTDGIEHWDGTRVTGWGGYPNGLGPLGRASSATRDTAWVAGVSERSTIGYDVMKYEDGLFHISQTPSVKPIRSVWASPSGSVYAVGDGGTILRRSVPVRSQP